MSTSSLTSGFWTSELGKRVFSAVIMLVVVLSLSWIGGWPFLLMSFALSLLLYFEWQKIVRVTPFDGTEALLTAGFIAVAAISANRISHLWDCRVSCSWFDT